MHLKVVAHLQWLYTKMNALYTKYFTKGSGKYRPLINGGMQSVIINGDGYCGSEVTSHK